MGEVPAAVVLTAIVFILCLAQLGPILLMIAWKVYSGAAFWVRPTGHYPSSPNDRQRDLPHSHPEGRRLTASPDFAGVIGGLTVLGLSVFSWADPLLAAVSAPKEPNLYKKTIRWVSGFIISWLNHCSRMSLIVSRGVLVKVQCLLMVTGVILLLTYAAALLHSTISSRLALREFDKAQMSTRGTLSSKLPVPSTLKREGSAAPGLGSVPLNRHSKDAPLAVLEFRKLGVRVPVFEGTNRLTLNRGAGWIAGTSPPGESGNVGIAAHRDGFFRFLKDVSAGDAIELSTQRSLAIYTVDQIAIVSPNNTDVLRPQVESSLTLVTCYPFHYVGPAPKRYILHAVLKQQAGVSAHSLEN